MPSKALVFGITLVMLISILVFMVEIFLPLSAKIEFDSICRKAVLQMEVEGGLANSTKNELIAVLQHKGFTNLIVQGTGNAKYGDDLSLKVTADYKHSMLVKLFARKGINKKMQYDKITISRKVIN